MLHVQHALHLPATEHALLGNQLALHSCEVQDALQPQQFVRQKPSVEGIERADDQAHLYLRVVAVGQRQPEVHSHREI